MVNPLARWRGMPLPEFAAAITRLPHAELDTLNQHVRQAVAAIQAQLEIRGKADLGWWKQARAALGYLVDQRHALSVELGKRGAARAGARTAALDVVREDAARARTIEDLRRVVDTLIDVLVDTSVKL